MSADPTAEHIDAVAVEFEHVVVGSGYYAMNIGTTAACEAAREILTSINPETHAALAASLPAEVKIASLTDAEMLAALVDRGTLTERFAIRDEGGSVWLDAHGDHREAKPGGLEFADRGDAEGIVARPHEEVVRRHVTPWEVAE